MINGRKYKGRHRAGDMLHSQNPMYMVRWYVLCRELLEPEYVSLEREMREHDYARKVRRWNGDYS